MRWGFGMKQGPFELWQEAGGWRSGQRWCRKTSTRAKRCATRPAPGCSRARWPSRWRTHTPKGSWNAAEKNFVAPRCPSTKRQIFLKTAGRRQPARLENRWHHHVPNQSPAHLDAGRGWQPLLVIRQHQNKMHAISPEVMEGPEAVELAEREYDGMVIWSGDAPFSGADLETTMPAFAGRRWKASKGAAEPDDAHPLRPGSGGGCHPRHGAGRWCAGWPCIRPAAWRTWKPTSAWSKWAWPGAQRWWPDLHRRRAAKNMAALQQGHLLPFLTEGFTAAAMAKVGTSAR